jgi:hypothetical protein
MAGNRSVFREIFSDAYVFNRIRSPTNERSHHLLMASLVDTSARAQTLRGKLTRRRPPVQTRIERWETPDDDFLEIHRLGYPRVTGRFRVL